jgi:hypothetical protein
MTTVLDDRPPVRARRYTLPAIVAIVLVVAGAFLLGRSVEPAHFVDRVTVVNGTAFSVDVDVADGDSTVSLGTAPAGETEAFHDVVDQGSTWVFRFRYAGLAGGELHLTRAELERRLR